MAADVLRRAARALADTRLRTFLTIAGITIGIAALFSLLSIAEGIRTRIVDKWLKSGLMTSLTVFPRETMDQIRRQHGGGRRRPLAEPESSGNRRPLDDETVAAISRIEGVRRAWPVISRLVMVESSDSTTAPGGPGSRGASASDGPPSSGSVNTSPPPAPETRSGVSPEAGVPAGTESTRAEPASTRIPPASSGPRNAGSTSASTASSVSRDAMPTTATDRSVPRIVPTPPAPTASSQPRPPSPVNATTFATLRGFDTDFFWGEDYVRISAGRPLRDAKAREALVFSDVLAELGFKDPAVAVGKSVIIRWREMAEPGTQGAEAVPGLPFSVAPKEARYTIVGALERRGALSLRNAGILVPTEQARTIPDPERMRALFEGGATTGYPGLDVYLSPGADLEKIESRIKEMGFGTISGAEIVSQIRRSILVLQSVLGGLGTIAIAVATLGIANTLLTAVYERMREIGVMKAVGARCRDIRRQFFAEAALIGFTGGVAGLLVGFGADKLLAIVIGHIVRRQGGEDPGAIAVHTPVIALGCLLFSVVLSLLAGTFPAARAARLDPIQTLRHE